MVFTTTFQNNEARGDNVPPRDSRALSLSPKFSAWDVIPVLMPQNWAFLNGNRIDNFCTVKLAFRFNRRNFILQIKKICEIFLARLSRLASVTFSPFWLFDYRYYILVKERGAIWKRNFDNRILPSTSDTIFIHF